VDVKNVVGAGAGRIRAVSGGLELARAGRRGVGARRTNRRQYRAHDHGARIASIDTAREHQIPRAEAGKSTLNRDVVKPPVTRVVIQGSSRSAYTIGACRGVYHLNGEFGIVGRIRIADG